MLENLPSKEPANPPPFALSLVSPAIREKIENLLSSTNLHTDHARDTAIPQLLKACGLDEELVLPALDVGIRLGKDDIPFCSTLEYGVGIAIRNSKGDLTRYKENLTFLEDLARSLTSQGINPYRTLNDVYGHFDKFLDGAHSFTSVLSAANALREVFLAIKKGGLRADLMQEALPKIIELSDSPEMLEALLRLEHKVVGLMYRKETCTGGEGVKEAHLECTKLQRFKEELLADGYEILEENVVDVEYDGPIAYQQYRITYAMKGEGKVIEKLYQLPLLAWCPPFSGWKESVGAEDFSARAKLSINRAGEYFDALAYPMRALQWESDMSAWHKEGKWALRDNHRGLLSLLPDFKESSWESFLQKIRKLSRIDDYSLPWEEYDALFQASLRGVSIDPFERATDKLERLSFHALLFSSGLLEREDLKCHTALGSLRGIERFLAHEIPFAEALKLADEELSSLFKQYEEIRGKTAKICNVESEPEEKRISLAAFLVADSFFGSYPYLGEDDPYIEPVAYALAGSYKKGAFTKDLLPALRVAVLSELTKRFNALFPNVRELPFMDKFDSHFEMKAGVSWKRS